jgi:AcrR family transcriptional regulator
MISEESISSRPQGALAAPSDPEAISNSISPLRAKRRAARSTQILALAMRQVETQGLDGLTLQKIARDLDYTVPALYRYFASKDALVAALQRRIVALLDRKLAGVEARTQQWLARRSREDRERFGPLAPIVATGLFYSGLARSAPQAFGLLAASLGDPRHLIDDGQARAVVATALPMFDRLAHSIETAVESRQLDPGDAPDRVLVFWSSLHGVAQLAKLERLAFERLDSKRLCSSLLEVLLIGWGGNATRVQAVIRRIDAAGIARATITSDDLVDVAAPPND